MDGASVDRAYGMRFSDEWTSMFSTSLVNACAQENLPFWVRPGQLTINTADLFKVLMRNLCEDSEPFLYQVVEVEGFCLQADLDVLAAGRDPRVTRPIALMDDRNEGNVRDNNGGNVRPSPGALRAHQLYQKLRVMVGQLTWSIPSQAPLRMITKM